MVSGPGLPSASGIDGWGSISSPPMLPRDSWVTWTVITCLQLWGWLIHISANRTGSTIDTHFYSTSQSFWPEVMGRSPIRSVHSNFQAIHKPFTSCWPGEQNTTCGSWDSQLLVLALTRTTSHRKKDTCFHSSLYSDFKPLMIASLWSFQNNCKLSLVGIVLLSFSVFCSPLFWVQSSLSWHSQMMPFSPMIPWSIYAVLQIFFPQGLAC